MREGWLGIRKISVTRRGMTLHSDSDIVVPLAPHHTWSSCRDTIEQRESMRNPGDPWVLHGTPLSILQVS
jgi:hypothetical protein